MRVKYVEAVSQKKYPKRIFGIELQTTKAEVSILGSDMSEQDDIEIYDIDKSEYKITEITKDRVENIFKIATLELQKDLNDSIINIIRSKRSLKFAEAKLKQYFNKSLTDIKLEELP